MRKRGQFTLFVIVGLLIVSVVMLGVYYKDEIFVSEWEKQKAQSLVVPEEAEEFKIAVDDCINEVSLEALKILGLHGGYIKIPNITTETIKSPTITNNVNCPLFRI